ncbi:fatty acid desaturase [Tatumella terrea]|uniref:Fatty acid desaturase n=1 Tax=Tatumella terrea TaxID=419007 RepID=A0ABW1VYB8_9GAMM
MADKKTVYLNLRQQVWVKQQQERWLWRSELPTWGLIVAIYAGWFGVFALHKTLGLLLTTLILIWFTAWYMSLQHELIHGHPTRYRWLNQLFGLTPLAVWFPYGVYRDSHLAHHRNESLTHPGADPETYYFSAGAWQQFGPVQRAIIRLRNTFPGRLLIGPLIDIARTLKQLLSDICGLRFRALGMWAVHCSLLLLVFHWVRLHDFSVIYYLLAVTYPALALTKVRSFFEHRAADDPAARSVINEAGVVWRLLFLNLNYHSVHHDLPGVPWYGLRKLYQRDRENYQHKNQGFVVAGYRQWCKHYLRQRVNVEVHPAEQGGEHD